MQPRKPLLALGCLSLFLVACGINEMPAYKNRIAAVQLDSGVDSSAEVSFASLAVADADDPDEVALAVMETGIRERLAERLDRLAHPSILRPVFASSLADEFQQAFPWALAQQGQPSHARFRIRVTHYGVQVDEEGLASVFYILTIRGLFLPTGTVIYEQSLRSSMAMTEIYQGTDPVAAAAARTMNLMALDRLSDGHFQDLILEGADRAAEDLVEELFDDTYDD